MDLSLNKLKEAISIRTQIDTLERRLSSIFGTSGSTSRSSAPRSGRRSMSAATRAKLSAAAKARWAKRRGGSGAASAKHSRKKGGLTPEGRRKLSEAMKARWTERRLTAPQLLASCGIAHFEASPVDHLHRSLRVARAGSRAFRRDFLDLGKVITR